MPGKLGFLPFITRALLRRRVRNLETKVDKVRDRFCDLSNRIKEEKAKAANLMTKAQYDDLVKKVDEHLDEACECASDASEKPSSGERESAKTDMKKECKKKAAQALGWDSARGKTNNPENKKKWEALVEKCMKGEEIP